MVHDNHEATQKSSLPSNLRLTSTVPFESHRPGATHTTRIRAHCHREGGLDFEKLNFDLDSIEMAGGKKSGRTLMREEGLERTDNGLKQTSWPEAFPINQKNYYTEFGKRDDQLLASRLQNEANQEKLIRDAKNKDRALARTGTADVPLPMDEDEEDTDVTDELAASKIIVIHPGSQNLRIGLANDALPKTVIMAIAERFPVTESQEYEPRPKRQDFELPPEQQFGEEWSKKYNKQCADLKVDMRANRRKVLPNSKELVVNYNRRMEPEKIPEHNDPLRMEWTDTVKGTKTTFTGPDAQRIADNSDPPYRLFWPMQHGWFHENDYNVREAMFDDFETIIEQAMRRDLGLDKSSEWDQYSCVMVVPDLYDKKYLEQMLDMCLRGFEFKQVAFVQESHAATFGAGYTSACVVDVGAQKTSICCVEDGMCIEDSRVNLKYGGYDVTETFIKMMLYDHFPYADINLKRRYDFLLAEELKIKYCTMNQAEISVQLYNFHLRAPNQPTHKYGFKTYDEVILAPMGFYDPSIFDNSDKLNGRRKLLDRSYNAYDIDTPDDPTSSAQLAILAAIKPSIATNANGYNPNNFLSNGMADVSFSTPQKEKPNPFNLLRIDPDNAVHSSVTSAAASPAPEGASTPAPAPAPFVFGNNGHTAGSPGPTNGTNGTHSGTTPIPPAGMFVDVHARTAKDLAIERDSVLPISALDTAIITSITHAAKHDEKKARDFYGGIMLIGGGAKTPGFGPFLEDRLQKKRPDLAERILVGTSPREMDGQVVVWKGASVFARMKMHESWIGQKEFEMLGARVLSQKILWHY
ncbi:uncharacterized protein EAE97_003835 [Botrytis byssoidea]|uniref:Actin-related protein 8 n=1 Tax=Botrytis byssoidea TaxID=139641 RepID=A0A9P5INT0_9HELO|nr:uncharacterized protein EAE97_003835 [Botrytis byssoidea]KAF7948424.1 hypothetical protein EAE97_003835 [Botrytis byssoidea]